MPNDRILFSEHHLSHAASTFLCSPFDEAAILTVDGVGEWATATFGRGRGTEVSLLREIRFPHSLGLLYSAFTAFLGFEVNEGEYKVMGMAPYGEPKYVDKVQKLYKIERDGSLWLDMDYFCFHHSTQRTYNGKFTDLFGEPRDPKWLFFTPDSGYPSYFGDKPPDFEAMAKRNQYYADVAASIQRATEEIVLNMARALHEETGLERLCLAGGVALNSVANGRVVKETPFKELFVQPAAGDGGGALGAALYAQHCVLGQPRAFCMEHAYWGKAYGEGETADFVRGAGIAHTTCSNEDELLDRVVDHLRQGHVIGWFQNRFEWGPRALGARSIIADPGRADMKDIVNTKIKFREPFRPFAPSVIVDAAERYFDLPEPGEALPGSLHAFRGRRQARMRRGAAGHHARRRHGPAADRPPRPEPPLLRVDRAFRTGERRAGDPQHLVQLEGRADRHDAGPGAQHVHAQRNGRPGVGEHDRHQGLRARCPASGRLRPRSCWSASG